VVISLAGNTNFHEFAATVEAADLVIGNDSAASHLSAVFKRPCIAFFGPVPPTLRDHKRPGHEFHGLAGTQPCLCGYDFFREATTCPHQRQCLTSITVDRAFALAREVVGRSARG
jgi:ADP-heptose:LPS heptosyltransferase